MNERGVGARQKERYSISLWRDRWEPNTADAHGFGIQSPYYKWFARKEKREGRERKEGEAGGQDPESKNVTMQVIQVKEQMELGKCDFNLDKKKTRRTMEKEI